MPGNAAPRPAVRQQARGAVPWLLAPLARRIEGSRGDARTERDPDLIRRQLPAIGAYTSYFTPEVRGIDRLPTKGPVLLVGNHSCLFYMPEVWICGQAILSRRGLSEPVYLLTYDLLLAVPGLGPFLRRLGAIPANAPDAEAALARGACVVVYPGGDLEACRPWNQRNRIDFGGRQGFIRLALRCGVPVVPVVAHGGQHAVVVLTRGERLARAAGLHGLRIKVLPFLAGPPFGVTSILTPPPPMPAHLTVEFLPPLDWSSYGPDAADDPRAIAACYDDITGQMQAALDRLAEDHPYPLLDGFARLTARAAALVVRQAEDVGRAMAHSLSAL